MKFRHGLIGLGALISAAILPASLVLAQSSPVLGSWQTVANTPIGELRSTITFSQGANGPVVAVVDQPMPGMPGGPGASPPEQRLSDLHIEGSSFAFKRTIVSPQGPIDLEYRGSVDGDAMTATASSAFGAVDITGSRMD